MPNKRRVDEDAKGNIFEGHTNSAIKLDFWVKKGFRASKDSTLRGKI